MHRCTADSSSPQSVLAGASQSFPASIHNAHSSSFADLQTASHTASPPSPVKTLAKSISSRLDAAETFLSSTPPRADLAEQYQKEAAILKTFVEEKETMASDALDALVKTVLGELGLEKGVDGKSVGQVIKQVVEKAAGKAGGKEVSEAVRRVAATLTKA